MLGSSLKHHVSIDTRFVNMFMSVIILEGVGRQLDKNLNIISASLPIISYSIPDYSEVWLFLLVVSIRWRLTRSAIVSLRGNR